MNWNNLVVSGKKKSTEILLVVASEYGKGFKLKKIS